MMIRLQLHRDSDNSYPENEYLEITSLYRLGDPSPCVCLQLSGSDREVHVDANELISAVRAIGHSGNKEYGDTDEQ